MNVIIEGITIPNSPNHAVSMNNDAYVEDAPVHIRWVKILGWRNNGDGIGQGKNGLIEDCFIRTQDDATYVKGRGVRRVVYWQDVNGSTFVLTPIGALISDIPFYQKSIHKK